MDQGKNSTFLFGDRTYDFFKKLVQIGLPGFGTFYITLGQLWDLPRSDEVAGTCLALATFLGLLLGISSAQYKASGMGFDGEIKIEPQIDGPTQVKFITKTEDPMSIANKRSVTFKVNTETQLTSGEMNPEERPTRETTKKSSSK